MPQWQVIHHWSFGCTSKAVTVAHCVLGQADWHRVALNSAKKAKLHMLLACRCRAHHFGTGNGLALQNIYWISHNRPIFLQEKAVRSSEWLRQIRLCQHCLCLLVPVRHRKYPSLHQMYSIKVHKAVSLQPDSPWSIWEPAVGAAFSTLNGCIRADFVFMDATTCWGWRIVDSVHLRNACLLRSLLKMLTCVLSWDHQGGHQLQTYFVWLAIWLALAAIVTLHHHGPCLSTGWYSNWSVIDVSDRSHWRKS